MEAASKQAAGGGCGPASTLPAAARTLAALALAAAALLLVGLVTGLLLYAHRESRYLCFFADCAAAGLVGKVLEC